MDPRRVEVVRILDRYLVELVEAYDLCPWARPARDGGELAVDVLWGEPSRKQWIETAKRLLAGPGVRVAMIVAPEFAGDVRELRVLRDVVAVSIATAGVAHFHPDVIADATSPARLVPHLRRSPDPLLQLVPLALLDSVRGAPPVVDRTRQAQILGGSVEPPRGDVADLIAAANHARVTADADGFAARLADIAADRARSYARVGISASRPRR